MLPTLEGVTKHLRADATISLPIHDKCWDGVWCDLHGLDGLPPPSWAIQRVERGSVIAQGLLQAVRLRQDGDGALQLFVILWECWRPALPQQADRGKMAPAYPPCHTRQLKKVHIPRAPDLLRIDIAAHRPSRRYGHEHQSPDGQQMSCPDDLRQDRPPVMADDHDTAGKTLLAHGLPGEIRQLLGYRAERRAAMARQGRAVISRQEGSQAGVT